MLIYINYWLNFFKYTFISLSHHTLTDNTRNAINHSALEKLIAI
jgi:hypothetical protein